MLVLMIYLVVKELFIIFPDIGALFMCRIW